MPRETDNTLAGVLKLFGDLLDSKSGGTGDEVTSSEGFARYEWQIQCLASVGGKIILGLILPFARQNSNCQGWQNLAKYFKGVFLHF